MHFRYVGSGGQGETKFVRPRFQVVLGEPLSDLAGSASNDGILIGIVVRFPLEDVHAQGALFEAIEATVDGGLHDVAKKAGTLFTRAELMAFENMFEFGKYLSSGQLGPLRCLDRARNWIFRNRPHLVANVITFGARRLAPYSSA